MASKFYKHPTEGWVLAGDAAASYLRMRESGMPSGGIDVFRRTFAKQARLYALYKMGLGNLAAKPSKNAPHVKGAAFDTHTTTTGRYAPSSAHRWLMVGGKGSVAPGYRSEKIRANAYGWKRTVPSERWHFGYDRKRDLRRTTALKEKLAELGYSSLKKFQAAKKLQADGIDGPITWTALLKAKPPISTT